MEYVSMEHVSMEHVSMEYVGIEHVSMSISPNCTCKHILKCSKLTKGGSLPLLEPGVRWFFLAELLSDVA